MPPSAPFLTLQSATFRLGEQLIFPDTSWTWSQNEHWAVLGGNGSGKSLLADALRGLLPVVRGELNYHWQPPRGMLPEETIGHVSFEDRKRNARGAVAASRWNSLEEDGALRVGEFLSYERVMDLNPFEVIAGLDALRARFERRRENAIRLLEVGHFLERTLFSLSNGEAQRVQLAQALCHPVRLLILDEPFTGLDAAARRHFQAILERLMATPLRVLLLTTREEDLPRRLTHVLRLKDCRVVAAEKRGHLFRAGRQAAPVFKLSPGALKKLDTNLPQILPRSASKRLRASAAEPLLDLRQVTVRYGGAVVFKNLDWRVLPGESWAVLGPNGSGKTTLLGLIQGDHPQAYANSVRVFGRLRGAGESIWDIKRQTGWVSPELHLSFNDAQTCLDIVASGFHDSIGLFEPVTRRQRALARQWLGVFGLREAERAPLSALSSGLQRMVLLARALIKQPRLLILDEPCQGLDAAHRRLFIRTVDALLRQGGATALYVTHRLDEIPRSISRILRLNKSGARIERRLD
jgi:molybdate transport system ATP-binding protein